MSRLDPAFLAQPLAHRGLHNRAEGIVENSPSAFMAAIAGGFGIELDVQASSDGVPMVFHDDELGRLTAERGLVRERSARALQDILLAGSDDKVPSLEAVLAQVAGAVPVLVEIKDQDGALGRNVGGLTARVAELTAAYQGPVAVMSFNPHHVEGLSGARGLVTDPFRRQHWPGVPSDRLAGLAGILEAEAVGATFISHNRTDLGRARVAELKAAGLDVLCWTVRSAEEEADARRIAQNITFEGYDPRRGPTTF